jgi:hypothetical protein
LHTSVIRVKALELSKDSVDKAVKKAVNNVLEKREQIAAGFKALRPL